jgi:hypothetical protein
VPSLQGPWIIIVEPTGKTQQTTFTHALRECVMVTNVREINNMVEMHNGDDGLCDGCIDYIPTGISL